MLLLRKKLPQEPLEDDSQLTRTDPLIIGELYWLLENFIKFAQIENIVFWGHFGSLLGAVRHKGIIPWDQDIDLQYFESDTGKITQSQSYFEEQGIDMKRWWGGFKLFRKAPSGTSVSLHRPAIDLYPSKTVFRKKIVYSRWRARLRWYYSFFHHHEAFPLSTVPFGPASIPIPGHYKMYLERVYGKDWNVIAYKEYDNLREQKVKPIKLQLVDRSPANFIFPEKR